MPSKRSQATESKRGAATTPCRLRAAAERAMSANVKAGAQAYDRVRDLPALIRADPFAPIPESLEARRLLVARLRNALRAERNRARTGHWTYDLNRHIALRQAFVAECDMLAALQRAERRLSVRRT